MIFTKGRLSPQLILLSSLLVLGVSAAPPVNVALRADFDSAPFLLELLETAAEENATAYFPLLDRIAEGYFDEASTDQELHELFLRTLQEDEHLSDPETLSSFQLALSLRSTAPRIEAHYQFYNTTIGFGQDSADCENWVYFNGQKHCSPDLANSRAEPLGSRTVIDLPFDRILGDVSSKAPSILYADIISPGFRKFHRTISATAKAGKTSYRLRYKPSKSVVGQPLYVSGYGVQLALKRTDYIVIDDREEAAKSEEASSGQDGTAQQATLADDEVTDLRPLSSSELRRLDMKAASFVMGSEQPFETLLKLSQDFPKHSSALAAVNVSQDLVSELMANRETFLPPGYNIMWINGVQILPRDIDAFAMLELLRRERKLINGAKDLGLTSETAIKLFSHEAISDTQSSQDAQRYDWRDDIEGGGLIMWLNNIEKDKRYADWPSDVHALLQRTFPGQLPSVRKDIHNVIVPVDFSDYTDVSLIVENVQMFIKRGVPIRFGLVPKVESDQALTQAVIVRHLVDTYGLGSALGYLEKSLPGRGKKLRDPDQSTFEKAADASRLRKDKTAATLQRVLQDESLKENLDSAKAYSKRLGLLGPTAPCLVNGVPVSKGESWMQTLSGQVGLDLRKIQQSVYLEKLTNADSFTAFLLADASARRNPIVIPEDDKDVRHINLASTGGLREGYIGAIPALWPVDETFGSEPVSLIIAADLNSAQGGELFETAMRFRKLHGNVELFFVHTDSASTPANAFSDKLWSIIKEGNSPDPSARDGLVWTPAQGESDSDISAASGFWKSALPVLNAAGLTSGEAGIIINGRVVGPLPRSSDFDVDDFEALLSYERKKRLLPAATALQALGLHDQASSPFAFAKMSNMIALSTVSDIPEGIFESSPTARTSIFDTLQSQHSVIHTGDRASSSIQIVAAVDPASEQTQRWLPILKVLSELDGVHLRLFLNPRERLEELPVKRFYRYVFQSGPTFDDAGRRRDIQAEFKGLPAEALLTIGMDMPPAWLVSPVDSVHDLDNLRLTSVKGDVVQATYLLDHILIEGHSRDAAVSGNPPRGAQLVLSTQQEPHIADTIIMSNLGYFQFKTNPGFYNLSLQSGRSTEIFKIDSAGGLGYKAVPGDESTDIALTSFRGATLYPRLSRKPGMEEEDVLEPAKSTMDDLAEKAGNVLSNIGIDAKQAGDWLSKASKFGSSVLSGKTETSTDVSILPHADINIFSVASGHLYERMLNIMMVSVMKHTSHTVKFWFIEQFLSPSFKAFIPSLAEEYGFRYEMVTYKWPHWLRAQKEKQREIWGYKILFLDVLFPLDLDKVIFVDADQIVRTDMYDLVQHDLKGAAYGFTPMCDSRTEMEGFRFWKQGYWANYLRGLPYHISALYVVDLVKFRQIAAGDRLRQQYHQLSADPQSLSNLDQDLPNHMQHVLPIHSLPQEWLWCETWCSDEALTAAKTIDLCNNPQTKEPKLERARRQVPEWTVYDEEIAALAKRKAASTQQGAPIAVPGQEDEQARMQEEEYREKLMEEGGKEAGAAKTHGRDEL